MTHSEHMNESLKKNSFQSTCKIATNRVMDNES